MLRGWSRYSQRATGSRGEARQVHRFIIIMIVLFLSGCAFPWEEEREGRRENEKRREGKVCVMCVCVCVCVCLQLG